MGADIIIGSYVGFNGYKADKLQSVSGIMEQIAMLRSLDDFEGEKKLVDVLIKPKTEGFSIFEFDNVDSLIQRGYKAALPFKARFRKLADSPILFSESASFLNLATRLHYPLKQGLEN